ncbi:MAG TPA: YdiU family protein [Polyangiaceae bacterium]|nr:YdiU family protein [Polyangiaceae bacterium]
MLTFDNRALRSLPIDPSDLNRSREVLGACFSRVQPTKVKSPSVIAVSSEVASLLDLPESFLQSDTFAQVFAGNQLLPGMDAASACYGGHQFGNWAGQLGDGRAITLGEVKNARGEHWEVQLKGAGPTPYSRRADGRAVLRSSVREFLCSEAMHALGVPTTRALSLVTTGESVTRDILYDGHPREEPGAVVCRVAPSFLRFGNYEIFAARDELPVLRRLVDYTIRTYFPELGEPSPAAYAAWFAEVTRRTAELIAHWMGVGFVHGVMNTDNMSILGLTIDYGPYGFLDDYAPDWTPNITDAAGRRYRYISQPRVALWNLACLGTAIQPLLGEVEPLEAALKSYRVTLEAALDRKWATKLGISELREDEVDPSGAPRTPDSELVAELFELLAAVETDMTIFFRRLALVSAEGEVATANDDALLAPLQEAFYEPEAVPVEHRARLTGWLRRYVARVGEDRTPDAQRKRAMDAVNPKYVLRNYVAQMAIDRAEQGDNAMVSELLEVLRRPFDEQPGKEQFAGKRPEWARNRAGCSMLSCSS